MAISAELLVAKYQTGWSCVEGLEVIGHSADGLEVGVLSLPLHVAAIAPSLHDVHAPTIVRLLVQHPAEGKEHVIWSV